MSTLPDPAGVRPDATLNCGALVRAYPWTDTPLGAMDSWDPVVRATVEVILADSLNVVDLLNADLVLIEQPALARMQEVYA